MALFGALVTKDVMKFDWLSDDPHFADGLATDAQNCPPTLDKKLDTVLFGFRNKVRQGVRGVSDQLKVLDKTMAIKYSATSNNEVICTHTVVLARCRTAEEAQQLVSLLNSGLQRMVDDWLAQNDGPIPGDVFERIQREWREHLRSVGVASSSSV